MQTPPTIVHHAGRSPQAKNTHAGFKSGSMRPIPVASCPGIRFNPRANSTYGSAIWNTPSPARNSHCMPLGNGDSPNAKDANAIAVISDPAHDAFGEVLDAWI